MDKPILGIRPRWLVEQIRIDEIEAGMARQREAGEEVPDAWKDEVEERKVLSGRYADYGRGKLSDGYHTFDELYWHRAVLFAALQAAYKERSWKSTMHADGSMFPNMFIAGIDTPAGQYTYHVENSEWALFTVREVKYAPEWDGHKPEDATRLLTLPLRDEHGDKWRDRWTQDMAKAGMAMAEYAAEIKRLREGLSKISEMDSWQNEMYDVTETAKTYLDGGQTE